MVQPSTARCWALRDTAACGWVSLEGSENGFRGPWVLLGLAQPGLRRPPAAPPHRVGLQGLLLPEPQSDTSAT